jgi:hypothetical protein
MSWHTDYWFLASYSAQLSQPSARSLRRRPPTRRPVSLLQLPARPLRPLRKDRTSRPRRRNRRPHPALARRLPRRPPRRPRRQLPRHRRAQQPRRPIPSRRLAWPVIVRKPKMAQRCTVRKLPVSARASQRKSALTNNSSKASWTSNTNSRTVCESPSTVRGAPVAAPAKLGAKSAPACHPAPRPVDPHSRMKSTAAGGFSARCRSGRRRRSRRAAHAVH